MTRTPAILVLAAFTVACERVEDVAPEAVDAPAAETAEPTTARADSIMIELIDTAGAAVGRAVLTGEDNGVRVVLTLTGLTPGEHGVHFHENPSCEAPSFESAGGHFNPHGRQHGLENPQGAHAGDMLNVTADPDGAVSTTFVSTNATLRAGDAANLLGGTSFVVHADRDDQRTDPSGNAGARVACGVIALE